MSVALALLTLAVFLALTAAGLAVNRRALPADSDTERLNARGLPLFELVVPVRLLAALMVTFVLVQTYASFQDADDDAAQEAGAVVAERRAVGLLAPPLDVQLDRRLRCYALLVAGPEWTSLADDREPAAVVDRSNLGIDAALRRAVARDGDAAALNSVLVADRERLEARRGRLSEAQPTVPDVVTALLILVVALALASYAVFADPRMGRRTAMVVCLGIAAVYALAMVVIFDVDRPFGGWARVASTPLSAAADPIPNVTPRAEAAEPDCRQIGGAGVS